MNSILVPTLALDISLLQRLADSVDYLVKDKIVINNGKPGALDEWSKKNPHWNVIDSGENLGVSGSWNLAPKLFNDDAWLIINDDQELQPGCLEKICLSVDANPYADIHYVNPFQAFDIFVWTRNAVKKFGLFDENFYPAYYEDWEMRMRLSIMGAKINFISDESFPVKHGKPYPAGERYHDALAKFDIYNRDYFMQKWGKIGDQNPVYKTPFNNPKLKVSDWKLLRERRAEMKLIWDEFFNHPNVSLYDHV